MSSSAYIHFIYMKELVKYHDEQCLKIKRENALKSDLKCRHFATIEVRKKFGELSSSYISMMRTFIHDVPDWLQMEYQEGYVKFNAVMSMFYFCNEKGEDFLKNFYNACKATKLQRINKIKPVSTLTVQRVIGAYLQKHGIIDIDF